MPQQRLDHIERNGIAVHTTYESGGERVAQHVRAADVVSDPFRASIHQALDGAVGRRPPQPAVLAVQVDKHMWTAIFNCALRQHSRRSNA